MVSMYTDVDARLKMVQKPCLVSNVLDEVVKEVTFLCKECGDSTAH